jgi:hypothetical protein
MENDVWRVEKETTMEQEMDGGLSAKSLDEEEERIGCMAVIII